MSWKRLFLLGIATVLAGLSYVGTRFWFEIGDKTLGVRRGSVSEMQSRDAGFYIGTYVPTKRLVALNPPSALHIPDAWVEHAWKRELSFLLRETKEVADGYYVYIPIPADESPEGRKPIWKFGFSLELEQIEGSRRSYHGTGFDSGLGFVAVMDTLPETLTFAVKQKEESANNRNDEIITDRIEFKRAF